MIFKYTAIDENGEKEKNILTAENIEIADSKLRERKLRIIKIEAVNSSVNDSPHFLLLERSKFEKNLCQILISDSEKEAFLGQIAIMLDAGVPILNTLQIAASQSRYFLSRAIFCAVNKLQTGKQFKDVLLEEMSFLGHIVIGMISAGEVNGDIDKMCLYSAELLERNRKVKGQILQAFAYPSFVILATIGIVIFLMLKVIPKINDFLSSRSGQLPAVTQALVNVTKFLQKNALYILFIPIIVFFIITLLRKNAESAIKIDYIALRIPIIGKIFSTSNNMLWCRTLGILLKSGINIIPALEFSGSVLKNNFYAFELNEIKKLVSQGHSLSTALRVSELNSLIPMAEAMLVVGENTGKMDISLLKVAESSDTDLQKRISFLTKMIEPTLFVIVGGIVGFVYIAFFMGLMAASTGK